jgi:hypothetical protein
VLAAENRRSIGVIVTRSKNARRAAYAPVLSSSISSLTFALLPKCPACLVLMLAPLGVKLPGSRWFLLYAVLMMAAIPLVFFATSTRRKSVSVRPMLLAVGGLLTMTLGRLTFESNIVVGVGIAVLFTAAFWTARSAWQRACSSCQ